MLWHWQPGPPPWLCWGEERVQWEEMCVDSQHDRHGCSTALCQPTVESYHHKWSKANPATRFRAKLRDNGWENTPECSRYVLSQCCLRLAHMERCGSGFAWGKAVMLPNRRHSAEEREQCPRSSMAAISLLWFKKNRKQALEVFSFSMVTQQNKTGFPSKQYQDRLSCILARVNSKATEWNFQMHFPSYTFLFHLHKSVPIFIEPLFLGGNGDRSWWAIQSWKQIFMLPEVRRYKNVSV